MHPIDQEIDRLYDEFDELLLAGKFAEADERLRNWNIQDTTTNILVGVLTTTYIWSKELRDRRRFYERVYEVIEVRRGKGLARVILDGLD